MNFGITFTCASYQESVTYLLLNFGKIVQTQLGFRWNLIYLECDVLYLHAFAPVSWKWGTLRALVTSAYLVCSNNELLHKELAYLKSVFLKKNVYPLSTV